MPTRLPVIHVGEDWYALKLTTNALCFAQEITDCSLPTLMNALDACDPLAVRALLCAALRHDGEERTLESCGEIIDAYLAYDGSLQELSNMLRLEVAKTGYRAP